MASAIELNHFVVHADNVGMDRIHLGALRMSVVLALAGTLAACDIPGLGPDPRVAQREANARAVGAACRYGVRSIEDCYALNEGISKSDIYAGWREMDQYMRENKLEGQRASVAPPEPPVETIIDDSKSKTAKNTKTGATTKPGASTH